jgi:mRNA interferase RelE/StbE
VASYRLRIKSSAAKELERVSIDYRRRLATLIQRLSADPRPAGCEKLSGHDLYRVRLGAYRVVYAVHDAEQTVLVFRIGHRREVYR